ncbi:MAG: hypothetical protein NT141_01870 [candidate division WWE3 bacterium]|nr:hypothetical protein [candidate division WWE3 bacterium]
MDKDRNPILHDAMGDLTFVGVVGNINGFVEVTMLFEPKIPVTGYPTDTWFHKVLGPVFHQVSPMRTVGGRWAVLINCAVKNNDNLLRADVFAVHVFLEAQLHEIINLLVEALRV